MIHILKTEDLEQNCYVAYCGEVMGPIGPDGYGEFNLTVFPARSDCTRCKTEDRKAHP